MQRTYDDLKLWGNNKRLMHKTQDGGSPMTGVCTLDSYQSAIRWLADETPPPAVRFSDVCNHLDLDVNATIEAFLKLIHPDVREVLKLRIAKCKP